MEGHGRAWRAGGRRAVAVGMPDGGEVAYRAGATEGAGGRGGDRGGASSKELTFLIFFHREPVRRAV